AWDRNLTDEDGPYIELMTGAYTDNQPDFSWLQPYEEKSFKQYFMPYKNIGIVKNASIDAAVNLDVDVAKHTAALQVYATTIFTDAVIELRSKHRIYVNETVTISPTQTFATVIPLEAQDQVHDLTATVKDANGTILVTYRPEPPTIVKMPEAARPLPAPQEMKSNEALYLAGLHLEQYRHATFAPEPYYLEGLKRDPGDIRINTAYGTLLLRRGLLRESEAHFRAAIATLTQHNSNPYDSEAYYQLGMTLKLQVRLDEAFSAFYKAVWSAAWQDAGYFSLAQIACAKHTYTEALELVERSLLRNARNYKACHLKVSLLRKLGRLEEAMQAAVETTRLDITDFAAYNEQYLLHRASGDGHQAEIVQKELSRLMRNDVHNFIALATDYLHCGLYEEGIDVLQRLTEGTSRNVYSSVYAMVHYYLGYLYEKLERPDLAQFHRRAGSTATPDYCFPNNLDDLIVLERAIAAHPGDARAHYYLGNLLYDKQRHVDAIRQWEASQAVDDTFATVHRNLALSYYNVLNEPAQALTSLEKAFACNTKDARVLYELDQLYKRQGYALEKRLANLESHWELVGMRDDLYLECIALLNASRQYEKVITLLAERQFHPWEGGEGKVTEQYVFAHVELGKQYLSADQGKEAVETLQKAFVYPPNLGEGKLAGAQENNIHYYLGCAYQCLGLTEKAQEHFQTASSGLEEPASPMFYNDQPPDMIFYQGLAWLKLNGVRQAKARFNKLVDYGEQHLFDKVTIDYFAVSLPDFLIFKDDLSKRNKVHCHYMMGLGHLGLGNIDQAQAQFSQLLQLDPAHQGARVHLETCKEREPTG
ncbi:MAG TPA: tetratricopeptide repeat protein, partial [Ktedonobacteraceae bacterium]